MLGAVLGDVCRRCSASMLEPNPPAQVVTVAWAAWSPFESATAHGQDAQRRVNLALKGGPSKNPDHVLCFHDLYSLSTSIEASTNSEMQIQLEFIFDSNAPKTAAAPVESGRSFVIPEQRNVQPKEPMPQSGDETILEVHPGDDRTPVKTDQGAVQPMENPSIRLIPPSQPKVKEIIQNRPGVLYDEKPTLKPIPMSRQIAILLADRKFDKILDRNGDEPHFVDFSRDNKFDLDSDFNDPLLCNEIIFYFKAVEMFEGVQVPNEIFLTLHFYKFPQICTESAVADCRRLSPTVADCFRQKSKDFFTYEVGFLQIDYSFLSIADCRQLNPGDRR
uniref:NPHP4 C2-like domain-containing protein n=1 Tax=Romanomermis culicivorax TaxID=13658 RepID=A0A915HZ75_ROMCU